MALAAFFLVFSGLVIGGLAISRGAKRQSMHFSEMSRLEAYRALLGDQHQE